MADDALSVDVRSVTPTMKTITFPKNAASAHPANHLRTVAMMFTALSEKQSENGHPSPFLRLSLPDAENRVNIYIVYQYFNFFNLFSFVPASACQATVIDSISMNFYIAEPVTRLPLFNFLIP